MKRSPYTESYSRILTYLIIATVVMLLALSSCSKHAIKHVEPLPKPSINTKKAEIPAPTPTSYVSPTPKPQTTPAPLPTIPPMRTDESLADVPSPSIIKRVFSVEGCLKLGVFLIVATFFKFVAQEQGFRDFLLGMLIRVWEWLVRSGLQQDPHHPDGLLDIPAEHPEEEDHEPHAPYAHLWDNPE